MKSARLRLAGMCPEPVKELAAREHEPLLRGQFVGELLILDVTLHAAADQQYRVVAGRVAQGDIADGDEISRHQLTRLCMLLPECWQCGGEEVRQLGRGEQSIRVIHGLGATGHKKEED